MFTIFSGIPAPIDHRASPEAADINSFFINKSLEGLEDEPLRKWRNALSFFSDEAFVFFLPAFMAQGKDDDDIFSSIDFALSSGRLDMLFSLADHRLIGQLAEYYRGWHEQSPEYMDGLRTWQQLKDLA